MFGTEVGGLKEGVNGAWNGRWGEGGAVREDLVEFRLFKFRCGRFFFFRNCEDRTGLMERGGAGRIVKVFMLGRISRIKNGTFE